MKICDLMKRALALFCITCSMSTVSDNQTDDLSPIQPQSALPFSIEINTANFALPNGIHSCVSAVHRGKWLFLAGRTNGLHNFNNDNNNFPPSAQNLVVYVVDPKAEKVYTRSLTIADSGLTQIQLDQLSVTSPQFYQEKDTLYIVGGYGVDTLTGNFSTKDVLTAINLEGIMDWVLHPKKHSSLTKYIRQTKHEMLRVTGGYMNKIPGHPTLLIFGQNFPGFYLADSNGNYTQEVRLFHIHDDGDKVHVKMLHTRPAVPDPNFRRRDLNVVPSIYNDGDHLKMGYIAYSGVFTLNTGVWTIPVTISANGTPRMQDPSLPTTFKQGMNNYICPTVGLFSEKHKDLYTIFLGGISYGFYSNGVFETDNEIPFINQVTAVQRDKYGTDTQYLMSGAYPVILSTQSNPGNPLLFGAGAQFINAAHVPEYENGVLKLDSLKKRTLIGYIVGGIQSTLPNTNVSTDSAASPYIFEVWFVPR